MNERFKSWKAVIMDCRRRADEILRSKNLPSVRTGYVFQDSDVQERMMRVGVEARALDPRNADEIMEIAVLTLIDDQARRVLAGVTK